MEAFAVCGLDLDGPSSGEIDEDEWRRCVVGLCVVLGDRPSVPEPWELVEGSMNGGFGLRRASVAVRRVGAATDAPRYVASVKVARAPPAAGWRRVDALDGSEASLTGGRLSAVRALYLWARYASAADCAFPPRAVSDLRLGDRRFGRDAVGGDDGWVVLDECGAFGNVYAAAPQVHGRYSAPLGVDGARDPKVLAASNGEIPSHFARFVLDAPTGLSRQRVDDVAAPEAFSFEMTDSRGAARHVACVRFDARLGDSALAKLRSGVERTATSYRRTRVNSAFARTWEEGGGRSGDEEDEFDEGDPASPIAETPREPPPSYARSPWDNGVASDDAGRAYAAFAPVVFCVVFRRPDALSAALESIAGRKAGPGYLPRQNRTRFPRFLNR